MITDKELQRLREDFNWMPNLISIHQNKAFENPNWIVPESTYSEELTATLDLTEGSSWWYETRNRIILKKIRSFGSTNYIWDIGCGPGVVASFLVKNGVSCIGVEPSQEGVLASSSKDVLSIRSDLASLQLPNSSLDQLGLFDVLEHVSDRVELLAEVFRILKPDGRLFVTVPALMALWSNADLEAGHNIRYSRKTLKAELERVGFQFCSSSYFFWTLVVPVFMLRCIPFKLGLRQPITDKNLISANIGLIGKFFQLIEVFSHKWFPIGTSLLIVARKPQLLE
jgi:SAM-dependent methyltransferase